MYRGEVDTKSVFVSAHAGIRLSALQVSCLVTYYIYVCTLPSSFQSVNFSPVGGIGDTECLSRTPAILFTFLYYCLITSLYYH